MPEGPEVEAAARRLRPVLVGRTLAEVRALHPVTRRALPAAAARACVGRTVVAVTRRGKKQFIELDDGARLEAHFGMTGDWWLSTDRAEAEPQYPRVLLRCDDGVRIALDDPRVLGWLRRYAPGKGPRLTLGPEADDPSLTAAWLHDALRRKRGPIKPVLMDQRLLAGLGNIYAAEACWHAGIHPAAPASRLSHPRVVRLLAGIRAALADGTARQGRYQDGSRLEPFAVYDRLGERCLRCEGRIARLTQVGRSTYFCPRCQR